MPQFLRAAANFSSATLSAGASQTSTVTGSGVDTIDWDGTLAVIQSVGTVTGTSPTLDGKIQESDTSGGTYTDVSGATFTQVTSSNSTQTLALDISPRKRFIRYVGTIAGTSPVFPLAVVFTGGKKSQ